MMENEIINEQVQTAADTAAQDTPEEEYIAECSVAEEIKELSVALVEAQTKLALLMNGAACSSLEEGARFALGLVDTGMAPEEAAQRTMQLYPHLRLTKRELPVFSAETRGSDGFAAIRNIFARR